MPDSGHPVWLVDCPTLFNRPGTLYQDQVGVDWPDNAQRFAHLSAVAARLALGELVPEWQADVVHANDWHTGLLPILLGPTRKERPATVFSIHNLAYQGLFPSEVLPSLPLPDGMFTSEGIEFYGKVSFLKAGIRFSDRITTVSPTYAREILTAEHGCGLDGLLRHRMNSMSGILNGVDYRVWDPTDDQHLPATFRVGDLSGKRVCKAELQRELGARGLPDNSADCVAQPGHRSKDGGYRLARPACDPRTRCSTRHAGTGRSRTRSPICRCGATLSGPYGRPDRL